MALDKVKVGVLADDAVTDAKLDLTTPALGTPASGVVTNLSGVLPVGVTGGSGLDATSVARNFNVILTRPSTSTVDIDAGYLTLFDSSNNFVILGTGVASTACNVTLNASLGNGLLSTDALGWSSPKWYHLYVIYNGSATSCVASLAPNWISTTNDGTAGSTKGVNKTNISGYTYGKYVGAVYRDNSGNFEEFYQQDNVCIPKDKELFAENTCDATHGCNESLVAFIPPTSYRIYIRTNTWTVDGSGGHIDQSCFPLRFHCWPTLRLPEHGARLCHRQYPDCQ